MLLTPPRPAPRNSFDDSGVFSRDNFGFNSSGCASVFIGRLGQAYGLQCILFMASPGRRGGHHPLSSLPPVSRSLVFGLPNASIFRHRWGYSFLSVQSATCRTLFDRPPQFLVLSEVPDGCLSVSAVAFHPDSDLCSSSSEGSLKIATWAPKDALLVYAQAISGWTSRQPLFM